jgi:hypothetical protein
MIDQEIDSQACQSNNYRRPLSATLMIYTADQAHSCGSSSIIGEVAYKLLMCGALHLSMNVLYLTMFPGHIRSFGQLTFLRLCMFDTLDRIGLCRINLLNALNCIQTLPRLHFRRRRAFFRRNIA